VAFGMGCSRRSGRH